MLCYEWYVLAIGSESIGVTIGAELAVLKRASNSLLVFDSLGIACVHVCHRLRLLFVYTFLFLSLNVVSNVLSIVKTLNKNKDL